MREELPVAVEIVEIQIPINVEGQRVQPIQNQLDQNRNVFPICCCLFCIVTILYVSLSVLKFLK